VWLSECLIELRQKLIFTNRPGLVVTKVVNKTFWNFTILLIISIMYNTNFFPLEKHGTKYEAGGKVFFPFAKIHLLYFFSRSPTLFNFVLHLNVKFMVPSCVFFAHV